MMGVLSLMTMGPSAPWAMDPFVHPHALLARWPRVPARKALLTMVISAMVLDQRVCPASQALCSCRRSGLSFNSSLPGHKGNPRAVSKS